MSFLLTEDGFLVELENGEGYILLEEANLMADQIEVSMPTSIIPEETTHTVTVYFRTRGTKLASTPTTIHYRVDCLTTRTEITDWTAFTTVASNISLTLTSAQNQILDDSYRTETKQVTIKADDGLSTQVIKPFTYKVRNQQGIN